MPRKLDENGQSVFTPGVSLAWSRNGYVFSGSLLKDCYDNHASALLFGREWFTPISNLSFQLLGGLYVRERPWLCSQGNCFEAVDIPWKIRSKVGPNSIDIIPMAFAGVNYRRPLTETSYVHVNLFSNIVLTHITMGLGWNF